MRPETLSVAATALGAAVVLVTNLPVAAQDSVSLNPMASLDKASLSGFLDHPLFDPSRRRPPAAPILPSTPVVASDEPPPKLHLLGVVHGDRDMAILQQDGQAKTIILHTGDRLGDWTLTVIPPVGVRLQSRHRMYEYALFNKSRGIVQPVDVSPRGVGIVTAVTVDAGPAAIGPVDAIGMPEVSPDSWGISP